MALRLAFCQNHSKNYYSYEHGITLINAWHYALSQLQNVNVYSQVLALVLRDYNFRHEIRAQSRGMFRNYVRTLTELYPVYRWGGHFLFV